MWAPIVFGLGTGFVMSISLGAVFFLLIQAGLAGGWRKGLPLALGVIVGDMIYVAVALHFSEAITESLVTYRSVIAVCGALALLNISSGSLINSPLDNISLNHIVTGKQIGRASCRERV